MVALLLASAVVTDSTARETLRVVREFDPIVVRAPVHDMASSETVHLIPGTVLRALPIDRLTDAVALRAGVVAQGGELHVRGGRAGESELLWDGMVLNEPRRYRPLEVPLLSVRSADLVSGGLDAEYGGTLAGVLDVRTLEPGTRWGSDVQWQSTGGYQTRYDRVGARIDGPLGFVPVGIVASADVSLDNTHLPALRTNGRQEILGGSFGWRADNRVLGLVKLATTGSGPRVAVQALANRIVDEPYDPMWSWDGYFGFCVDGDSCNVPVGVHNGPAPGYSHYNAADHKTMTDTRSLATLGTITIPSGASTLTRLAFGWLGSRAVTSLNGLDDASYITAENRPFWGSAESKVTEPFYVYVGDEPFFERSTSQTYSFRGDVQRTFSPGTFLKGGLGADYDDVSLWQMDAQDQGLIAMGIDSLRQYHEYAPGGFAYAEGRWRFQGLILNGGLRLQYFTARPPGSNDRDGEPLHGFWSLAPRFGFSYPISVRDAFSLAYVRMDQDPARDYLYDNRFQILNRRPFGNLLLEPSTVISYQAALKHVFDERWSLQLSLFYRDLFGLVGTRNGSPYPRAIQLQYASADEGHAMGFEVTALRAVTESSRFDLSYTWMTARGTQSREEGVPYGTVLGDRAFPLGEHPLDWDQRHSVVLSILMQRSRWWSLGWSTIVGSPLPWTPRPRREFETEQADINSARLGWSEFSSLSARLKVPYARMVTLGFDVRNVFDWRGEVGTTVNGYPHPYINTLYDDYSAYRAETGLGGGAYWEDADGDGLPGWVPVHDARLLSAPRTLRFSLGARF